ncbi:MAG: pyridoxine 5'-phosphate synthase [Desulfurivibrionaceae bacterium]|nr:pyridoxine 5'-phosphate synthase [Desulfurivibrionaceae bacterium]
MPVLLNNKYSGPCRVCPALLIQKGEALLCLAGLKEHELSLLLVDDPAMQEINLQWRQKDKPTNVLSFPQGSDDYFEQHPMLGDIIISITTADQEAREQGISLHQHLTTLLVHGFVHLLGYDHERSDHDAEEMFGLEHHYVQALATRRKKMVKLAINVDHVATLRQARGIKEPDPVTAAAIAELAGAVGIVVHLREDRRHIQDRDVEILRQTVQTKLNLEMAAAEEIIKIALELKPDMVTLVPEKRAELTTEGGLDVAGQKSNLKKVIARLTKKKIPVSLFIDPDSAQIQAAKEVGATFVEIHTGRYADATSDEEQDQEFDLIAAAAEEAYEAGLRVNAGHGLNYVNAGRVAALPTIEELSIGHAIMARAIFVGLDQAVREMMDVCRFA